MMSKTDFCENALQRLDLLEAVVNFKKKFYPRKWARYDIAVPGSICLMPPVYSEKALKNDYSAMRTMIFGDYPSWEKIYSALSELEQRINQRV